MRARDHEEGRRGSRGRSGEGAEGATCPPPRPPTHSRGNHSPRVSTSGVPLPPPSAVVVFDRPLAACCSSSGERVASTAEVLDLEQERRLPVVELRHLVILYDVGRLTIEERGEGGGGALRQYGV
jgi:hypothetical protein